MPSCLLMNCSGAVPPTAPERLTVALMDSRVDLNLHQVDATLFDEEDLAFRLHRPPLQGIPTGFYTLKYQDSAGHHYRLASPFARWVLQRGSHMVTPLAELSLKYSGSGRRVTILEPLVG